tara:strand:- start:93 stop:236 length:144 start_codon:yes stop_codon:yes gene_type:complete
MIIKVKKYSARLSLLVSVETPRVLVFGFFSALGSLSTLIGDTDGGFF